MRSAVLPWQSLGLVLALALASVAGLPPPQASKTGEKLPAPCVVSGQVVTAADGAPVRLARVALVQENVTSHPAVFAATTGSDGRFEVTKVAPGRYRFFASRSAYLNEQYQAKGTGEGAILTLAPGQHVDNVLFRMVRAAVVTGRVVDDGGEPMQNVAVVALRKPSPEEKEEKEEWDFQAKKAQLVPSSAATTDDRGEYRIFGLKPGEYFLKASESDLGIRSMMAVGDFLDEAVHDNLGSQYAPVFYPGVIQLDQAQPVTLAAGDEVSADLTMRHVKTVEIAGRVTAKDGKPAAHAYVVLYVSEVDGWDDEPTTTTNAKGEFTIRTVPPGSYTLIAEQEDEDSFRVAQQKLEVGDENIESLVIALGKGTAIHGRITPDGAGAGALDRIRIHLDSESEGDLSLAFARAKQDGSFQIPDVLDGSYVLRVYGLEQGWYVKSARLGAEDVVQKGLQVERGSSGGTLEIVISSAGAQLEGAVTEDDKPVVGAHVRAKPDPETPYSRVRQSGSTSTDQNGHFTLDSLPPGKYRVSAKLPSASAEAPVIISEPKIVTLGERDHQTVQLTLVPPQKE